MKQEQHFIDAQRQLDRKRTIKNIRNVLLSIFGVGAATLALLPVANNLLWRQYDFRNVEVSGYSGRVGQSKADKNKVLVLLRAESEDSEFSKISFDGEPSDLEGDLYSADIRIRGGSNFYCITPASNDRSHVLCEKEELEKAAVTLDEAIRQFMNE